MDSEERPFSMHDPEERLCEFCTDADTRDEQRATV